MIRFFVLICCFLLLLPHSSQATEPSPLHVKGTYYFTWNHIPLAKLWIAAQQSDTDYQFTASLKSKAIVSLFRKVKALTTSQGIYRDGVWQALTYHNEAHYSDETKTVDLSFAKSGKLLERTLSHDDDPNYRPVVAKDALKGVVTYGNALFVLRQSIHDALTSEQTEFIHYLYDGKRLMEITASITKNVPFEINKQPMTAYKVALKRHLVDGFTHKEKEKAKEGEPLAYLYFSNDNRLLPIGMEIELTLGNLKAYWEEESAE